ncbi:uncharacterized protein LOC8035319 isoform X2 [Ixodes scapularis]|uniref:uncharacterized protein LOC8035319 isoform X2 n=1 Tax=Ixodes scapularis TaxID=6945 RepID=UPI001C386A84|nr:uncharacterized protein LOC8035319 isoform X2 [Ixodes scapularis]
MPRGSTNSTEGSHSSSPSSLNAPRYGTMVPKRIFVGGISPTTTEAELHELFSRYGVVTNTKIIADRAGVSKGYGFVTFDSEEEAQRAQTSGANVMLRERRLNIAPAIKKQPFTRVYDPTQSVPNGTILYHNGIPYTYHNGMAFFVTPETAYQYSATSQTTTPAATTSSYPVVYQPSMYYPQHTAYQYQNVIPSQWNASSGQWRWAPPQSVGHPTYVYPTAAMMSMGGGIGGGDTSSEYQDPAIVETGTEVGALGLMLRKEDGGGGGSGALTASMAAVGLNSFWPKAGGGNPGFHQPASASLDCSSAAVPGRPVLDDNAGAKPPCVPSGKSAAGVEQQPAVPCRQFLPPRQRRYTAPPETPLANADGAQGGERDLPDGSRPHRERGGVPNAKHAVGGSAGTWRDCLFGGGHTSSPPGAGTPRSQCP